MPRTKKPSPENTGGKRGDGMPVGKPFEPGNPGRPKGSRNQFGEEFIKALQNDFESHGPQAIVECRTNDATAYLKVCASVLPKQLKVTVDPLEKMDADQLRAHAKHLAEQLGPFLAFAGIHQDTGEIEGITRH